MGQDNHIAIIETKTFTDKIYHLPKSMIPDHRYLNEANEAFLRLNRKSFEFLNINGYSQNGDLHIVSHNFVGAIPIRMPGHINRRFCIFLNCLHQGWWINPPPIF